MTLIRYEDYIMDTETTLRKMYGHFGEDPPQIVLDKLDSMMYSSQNITYKAFEQHRQNATESLYKWTKYFKQSTIEEMNESCKDVLLAHGYPLKLDHY